MRNIEGLLEPITLPEDFLPDRMVSSLEGIGEVLYTKQGNFTVALLVDGGELIVGVTKRDPNCDKPNTARGLRIALARAVRNRLLRERS